MNNPHLDSNFRDHIEGSTYCGNCEALLTQGGVLVKPYALLNWSHWGRIFYPSILATDENGKTIEGQIAKPARWVLTQINLCTHICYCIEHTPFITNTDILTCSICHSGFSADEPRTNVKGVNIGIINQTLIENSIHLRCLPKEFNEVRNYIDRHG